MIHKTGNFKIIQMALDLRRNTIIERQPHDHEFESGAEDLESDLLATISYCIFDEKLQPIEKSTIGETINCLKSITKLLETEGEKMDLRDDNNVDVFVEELKSFGIVSKAQDKIFLSEVEGADPDGDYDDDNYDYVHVLTDDGQNIKVKILSFFYMCGNDVEDYLYQWDFDKVEYKTHDVKDVIRFFLKH